LQRYKRNIVFPKNEKEKFKYKKKYGKSLENSIILYTFAAENPKILSQNKLTAAKKNERNDN
jgi:hypothetical protein